MITLTITALSHAGEGIGRHEGRAIFVPYALPGEIVRAEIVSEKKNLARARLLEVVTAAPDRVEPRCTHHARAGSDLACGGCQLQHLAYPAQLAFKHRVVIDQFTRVAGLAQPPVRAPLPAPNPFEYRNHAQFVLTPENTLGFQAAHSNRSIAIQACPTLQPALGELTRHLVLEDLPDLDRLTVRGSADDALVIFETEADAPELEVTMPVAAALLRPDGTSFALAERDYVVETILGREFKISAGSFFQVNSAQAARLVEEVLAALALTGGETVLEVYSGVGLFSAFVAPQASRLIGVEASAAAIADAVDNLAEFDHVELYEANAEAVLPALDLTPEVVLLDPPRAGCAPEVIAALLARPAHRIVYVACDPATLARDAKRLLAGGYQLDWVQPVDMFPQTYHVECVARFTHGPA